MSGTTIHSLLQIPVHPPKKNPAPELGGDQLDRLQKDFKGCRMLVIGNPNSKCNCIFSANTIPFFPDEMSMISPLRLFQIDQRLRQATGQKDQLFGGISLIMMGDYAQLPPVCDKALYEEIEPNSFGAKGKIAYSFFRDVIMLDTIMRQQGTLVFACLVNTALIFIHFTT